MGECGGEVVLNAERGRDGELRVGLGGAIAGAKGFGKLALGGGAGARGIGRDGGDELAEPRREPSFGGGGILGGAGSRGESEERKNRHRRRQGRGRRRGEARGAREQFGRLSGYGREAAKWLDRRRSSAGVANRFAGGNTDGACGGGPGRCERGMAGVKPAPQQDLRRRWTG